MDQDGVYGDLDSTIHVTKKVLLEQATEWYILLQSLPFLKINCMMHQGMFREQSFILLWPDHPSSVMSISALVEISKEFYFFARGPIVHHK